MNSTIFLTPFGFRFWLHIIAMLDYFPPETSCTFSGTIGENGWYTSTVRITLNAIDDNSGVKNTYYRIDSGSQQTYTSPFTVSSDGIHMIEYWSIDNVENEESHHTESFKNDQETPTLEITKPDVGIYWRNTKIWPIFKLTLLNWSKSFIIRDITIMASVGDTTSGIERVEFLIDDELKSTDSLSPYEWNWDETVFFTHKIEVKVYDNAGHMASESMDVSIFNTNLLGG